MTEIGIGLLGHAFMGKAHINAYKKVSYMVYPPPALPRLVAIAGQREEGVKEAANRYGFSTYYTDWRGLLSNPEIHLLDNSASNDVHAEACIAGAEAGKHLLCEKPMARNAVEAKQMLVAASRARVKHMVAFNYRFVPAVRQAYELVLGGHLGEIRHFRAAYLQDWLCDPGFPHVWRLDRRTAGSGALGDLGSHIIDLARFLVGEPKAVSAMTKTFVTRRPASRGDEQTTVDVDDAFAAVIEFEGGCLGTLEASRFALGRKNHQVLEINGAKGSVSFNLERLNELKVYWRDADRAETRGWTDVLVTEPSHPFMSSWWPPGHIIGWEHTFVHEIAHLLDAIANDRDVGPLGATFEDGYRNAVVCDAVIQSAQEKRRVEIDY